MSVFPSNGHTIICTHKSRHITQACPNTWNVSFTVWQLRRTISQSGEHFFPILKLFNKILYMNIHYVFAQNMAVW